MSQAASGVNVETLNCRYVALLGALDADKVSFSTLNSCLEAACRAH